MKTPDPRPAEEAPGLDPKAEGRAAASRGASAPHGDAPSDRGLSPHADAADADDRATPRFEEATDGHAAEIAAAVKAVQEYADAAAFEVLHQQFFRLVRSRALRACGLPVAVAEEVAQETWLRAFRALTQQGGYRHRSVAGLRAWLATLAANIARDVAKRPDWRASKVSLELVRDVPSSASPAESALEAGDMEAALLAACDGPAERTLVQLVLHQRRARGRVNWFEAGAAIGLTKHRIYRIRGRLEKAVRDCGRA